MSVSPNQILRAYDVNEICGNIPVSFHRAGILCHHVLENSHITWPIFERPAHNVEVPFWVIYSVIWELDHDLQLSLLAMVHKL